MHDNNNLDNSVKLVKFSPTTEGPLRWTIKPETKLVDQFAGIADRLVNCFQFNDKLLVVQNKSVTFLNTADLVTLNQVSVDAPNDRFYTITSCNSGLDLTNQEDMFMSYQMSMRKDKTGFNPEQLNNTYEGKAMVG